MAFAGTVIPICVLSCLPSWCYLFWGGGDGGPAEFSKRDNGATFRMRLKTEGKDWPLTGENILQLMVVAFFTDPWNRENP